ncbi:MAG: hypothetical protein RIR18_1068, partial [Pseudomonadota bacterium]
VCQPNQTAKSTNSCRISGNQKTTHKQNQYGIAGCLRSVRQIWGDLRGTYFQNAFLVGTLYIDASNDTVVPTKPKVEILPFEKSQLTPVKDHLHFAKIAESYWKAKVYPNHLLPELAPYFPVITVESGGRVRLDCASGYMLALAAGSQFCSSENALRSLVAMPRQLFSDLAKLLKGTSLKVADSPEQGLALALKYCRVFRGKRHYLSLKHRRQSAEKVIKEVNQVLAKLSVVRSTDESEKIPMTAAIYYHPEAYTTSGPKLMGRNAAGESFLRGFLTHSKASEFWAQVQQPAHAQHFGQTVAAFGRKEPVKAVDKNSLGALSNAGVVYFPGPGIGEYANHRALYGHGNWSLCGITHTTSSAGAMDALAALVTSPVQPWDAVICTSTAVKDNVVRLLQAQVDYLKDRLGITKVTLPQLPVIPLGIHMQDFVYTDNQKSAARKAIGADKDTLVVLFMGRLSFHAKAHPLAMYQALEQAAKATGKNVVLVECGWFANDYIQNAYADAQKLACPNVRVVTLDGRKAEDRLTAWASADVFCSLSDNIQETFGIVPIEAMAAGIPVVVADWDGYKDTVREGVDGFRIPTLMPQAGLGTDLALRHALEIDTYDMYCGHTCSLIAVDVEATAQAFSKLFNSPELRKQMGEAGQQRAREVYDWKTIIGQYEDLWANLNEIRKAQAPNIKPLPHPWPARMDPFHAFASYPTKLLTPDTVLKLVDANLNTAQQRLNQYRQLAMVDFAKVILPTEIEYMSVLTLLANGPQAAGAVVQGLPQARQAFVLRTLTWMAKMGVIALN